MDRPAQQADKGSRGPGVPGWVALRDESRDRSMSMRLLRRLVCLVALGSVGWSSGCAGLRAAPEPKGPFEADVRAARDTDAPGRPAPDTVERSVLREQALGLLMEEASRGEPAVRANAVEALAVTPSRLASVAPMALNDANEGVRSVAAMAIGRTRQCDLISLVEPLLDDSSAYASTSARYAMRRCGREVDLTPLAGVLLSAPDTRRRAHAAFLLGELNEPSAKPMLRDAATREVPTASDVEMRLLQLQIAEALFKLGEEDQLHTIQAALFASRPEDLEATALAVQIIGEVGARRSINDLINLEARQGPGGEMPAEVRLAVATALAKLGRRDGWFIAERYWDSESPAIRAQAAHVLGHTGHPEHLPMLGERLDDPSGIVRVAAAAAIVRITRSS